ncbi:MAG: family 10 glycosylhydrolase, partial [Geminicoccaceae bacterium]|nr:family 10 glycosylhydrolase [Geminicoccaceae bacterium]
MIKQFTKKIILLFVLYIVSVYGQKGLQNIFPKYEVRAAWITTVGGLDWPKTTNIEEQKRTLLEILNDLRDRNFNTIFFQVRSRADAMYNSTYEP